MKKAPFIETVKVKYTESEREWLLFRIKELKKWRKNNLKALSLENKIENEMSNIQLMSNQYLSQLAKQEENPDEKVKLTKFQATWLDFDKLSDEIFAYLCLSSFYFYSGTLFNKAKKRKIVKVTPESKKLKFIDDPTIADVSQITVFRDQRFI